MHEYDITLKALLRGSARETFLALVGLPVVKWLDVELPKVQNARVDLLGETEDGGLVHLELQSTNDANMASRMAEYCFGVHRQFGRFPRQIVLYVGEAPARMVTSLEGPGVTFRYALVDSAELDGQRLLASPRIGDNIFAILTRLRDRRAALREIVRNIAKTEGSERGIALKQLFILAGLRKMATIVEEEVSKVPILNDIMDHEVLGREYKRGLEAGKREGWQEGKQEGKQEGEIAILRRQIEARFGPLPAWAEQRLLTQSAETLENIAVAVLHAPTLDELLK